MHTVFKRKIACRIFLDLRHGTICSYKSFAVSFSVMNSEHTLQHILMQDLLIEGILFIIYRYCISLKFFTFHGFSKMEKQKFLRN